MSTEDLETISDRATTAQAEFKREYGEINIQAGLITSLRTQGIAADAVVLDCQNTGRRMVFMVRDAEPGKVAYQLANRNEDQEANPTILAIDKLQVADIVDLMKQHFANS